MHATNIDNNKNHKKSKMDLCGPNWTRDTATTIQQITFNQSLPLRIFMSSKSLCRMRFTVISRQNIFVFSIFSYANECVYMWKSLWYFPRCAQFLFFTTNQAPNTVMGLVEHSECNMRAIGYLTRVVFVDNDWMCMGLSLIERVEDEMSGENRIRNKETYEYNIEIILPHKQIWFLKMILWRCGFYALHKTSTYLW